MQLAFSNSQEGEHMAMTKEERAKAREAARPAKPIREEKPKKARKPVERKAATEVTRGSNTATAPTVEVAAQLQEAFDWLNHKLFEGALPPVMMSFARLKKAHGYFWAKQWKQRGGKAANTHEIALDPYRCSQEKDIEVLGTLAHEMVHELDEEQGTAPKRPYHTKVWAERMKKIGLHPSTTGQEGGKETGPNCSHYIIEGGEFEQAAKALIEKGFKFTWHSIPLPAKPEKGKKKKAGAKAKHTCPECEANAWGKPSLNIMCADCDAKMVCEARDEYEGDED